MVIVLVGGYWFYSQSGNTKKPENMLASITSKVLVPSEVTPKLVTLTTLERLNGQQFFKQAALGDVIVVYPEFVILYRPSIDKIITTGAVDPTSNVQLFADGTATTPGATTTPGGVATTTPGATTTTPAPTTPIGIEIRNGTATSGLAKKLSAKLTVDPMVTVPTTGNARDAAYAKTTIVNLSGAPLPASVLATIKDAEVLTALPAGEKVLDVNAKVLVIIGADISSKVENL